LTTETWARVVTALKSFLPISSDRTCPSCGNDRLLRIRRRAWMRLFRDGKAYECERCGQRFVVRPKAPSEPPA